MKIVDIANEIYIDSGSPTDTSIPAIAFWIRGKIGTINNLLYEDFIFDPVTQELTFPDGSEINYDVVAVIKQMYRMYDYEVQIRTNMQALALNNIIKIDDQGTSITRVNRNTVSQTYAQIRRDEIKLLSDLVNAYRNKQAKPLQVAGDDTEVGYTQQWPGYYPVYLRR